MARRERSIAEILRENERRKGQPAMAEDTPEAPLPVMHVNPPPPPSGRYIGADGQPHGGATRWATMDDLPRGPKPRRRR